MQSTEGPYEYSAAAANGTRTLGATGAVGDYLNHVILNVTTSATGTLSLKDGGDAAIAVAPANTPIGVYIIPVNCKSRTGAWQLVLGAGASAIGVGDFT